MNGKQRLELTWIGKNDTNRLKRRLGDSPFLRVLNHWLGSSKEAFGMGMGKAVEITRLERSAAELRCEAASAKDARYARRLLAIALVLEGSDRHSAAPACGMDQGNRFGLI